MLSWLVVASIYQFAVEAVIDSIGGQRIHPSNRPHSWVINAEITNYTDRIWAYLMVQSDTMDGRVIHPLLRIIRSPCVWPLTLWVVYWGQLIWYNNSFQFAINRLW